MLVIVMVVFSGRVVMVRRVAGRHVALGIGIEAQKHIYGQFAHRCPDHPHTGARSTLQASRERLGLGGAQQVGLVYNDHVGAGDLVFEEFGKRGFVVQVFVGAALGIHRCRAVRELPVRGRAPVDHGDHTIDSDAGGYLGPVESADQRLRQCQT